LYPQSLSIPGILVRRHAPHSARRNAMGNRPAPPLGSNHTCSSHVKGGGGTYGIVVGVTLLLSTKLRPAHRGSLHRLRRAIALRLSSSDFRDEVGVATSARAPSSVVRRGGLQRLHGNGDEAVNMVLHSDMAAMLAALLTTRLLVAALVLAAMPPLGGGDSIVGYACAPPSVWPESGLTLNT